MATLEGTWIYIESLGKTHLGMVTAVRKNGVTFRAKARLQAEEYLAVVDRIVTNDLINPSTRLDAIKSMVKWGELEPTPQAATRSGGISAVG